MKIVEPICLNGRLILLSPFLVTDIADDYISWLNNLEVVRYSNQRFLNHTRESCIAYLESFSSNDNFFLAIRARDNNHMIGTMTAYFSPFHGTVDIGLMIGDVKQWGKGLGLDAWKTLMDYLLSECEVRKITGGTLRSNIGMIRIMERSGMHLEAVREKQQLFENEELDELYFAKFCN